ncbi:MAG TPA: ABC transporter permease [Mesorhizobium sp.]|jgi:peptide/nickel transport system permease protein|uniref:ABC transporter permease n=1 Tax=Mesorhizobium sp. TaxID=1871066 RepID=UPI002DDD4EAA|nr:ABC transporter permease [Mesorhizobium sp.]HEV2501661.1 ABC transporter permease [Mesorhizobium sp.]
MMQTMRSNLHALFTLRERGSGKIAVGYAIIGLFVFTAMAAPWITTGEPARQDLLNRLAFPSFAHPLGTDQLGRDVWTRLVYAIQLDFRIGILGMLLPAILGSLIGVASALSPHWLDAAISRLADIIISLPLFVFFLALAGLLGPGSDWGPFGPGELPILLGFTLLGWVVYARLLRTEMHRILAMEYIRAAITGGLPLHRVIIGHVMPNAVGQTLVYMCVDIGLAILSLATLSFLGAGVPLDRPELGGMISASRTVISSNWWLVAAPGAVLALMGTGLALIGDGLDDRLKP